MCSTASASSAWVADARGRPAREDTARGSIPAQRKTRRPALVQAGPLVHALGTGFGDEPARFEHRGGGPYDGRRPASCRSQAMHGARCSATPRRSLRLHRGPREYSGARMQVIRHSAGAEFSGGHLGPYGCTATPPLGCDGRIARSPHLRGGHGDRGEGGENGIESIGRPQRGGRPASKLHAGGERLDDRRSGRPSASRSGGRARARS
jgi:hypothetical protein